MSKTCPGELDQEALPGGLDWEDSARSKGFGQDGFTERDQEDLTLDLKVVTRGVGQEGFSRRA